MNAGSSVTSRDWLFVAALAVGQLVSWGALYYSFSLFVLPMEAELGWSRTQINGALTLGLVVAAAFAWPVGTWIDRGHGRAVMTLGSLADSALLVGWSQVSSLWGFYLVWAGLGAAFAATLYEPALAVIARRYGSDYRSRITALTLVAGFASTIFIPLTQGLIELYGWRGALIGLALANLALAVPIHALLLRERRRRPMETRPGTSMHRAALSFAFRTPAFWSLAVCFTAYYATFAALSFHLVPLLVERGAAMGVIVAALALVGPAQVAARVLLLLVGERAGFAAIGGITMLVASLAALLLLASPPTPVVVFAFALVYGGANGAFTIVRATAVPELLGPGAYGSINGALAAPANFAKALGPLAAAALWRAGGGYDLVLAVTIAGTLLAAAGFWLATSSAPNRHPLPERDDSPRCSTSSGTETTNGRRPSLLRKQWRRQHSGR